MTPEAAALEANKAAIAFQLALTKIGVVTIAQALRLWQRVPATKAAEVADDWLEEAVQLVMSRRVLSRELAVAYYRLARALRTGTTIPDPDDPTPKTVTLKELRDEFSRLTESIDQPSETASKEADRVSPSNDSKDTGSTFTGDPVANAPETPQDNAERAWDESKDTPEPKSIPNVIPIDRFKGITKNGDAETKQIEANAEAEARAVLVALGPKQLQKRVKAINDGLPAQKVDQLREDAHKVVGINTAAHAERIVLNGARAYLESILQRDQRARGWARVSQTGTPCGFCAMLISRGPVYRSQESAERDGYHTNCHCIAIPLYRKKQYKDSIFDMNRRYEKLWPKVTKGYYGKDAMNAWRRYIRAQAKTSQTTTAQAA